MRSGHAPGCFLIGTAIDAAAESDEVQARIDRVFKGLRGTLRKRVELAVADGDLPADVEVDALTEIIFATHVTLAVAARAGSSRNELRKRFESVVGLVGGLGR